MDLFTPIVTTQQQHPNFANITTNRHYAPERKVIQSWADGFVDRDNKFVREFQTTFNSSFWELYLHASFRELGFSIDMRHPCPDFLVRTSNQDVVAEAAIASNADGYLAEWEHDWSDPSNIDHHELLRSASLRLSNSIAAKLTKYTDNYSNLSHVRGKPFLLCLAAFDQPFFYLQKDNAIRRVLYGLDQPLWIPGRRPDERILIGESLRPTESKDSGAEVEFGIFAKPGHESISAVLFSSTATFGKTHALTTPEIDVVFHATRYNDHGTEPLQIHAHRKNYSETLLDGLHVFLNPFAQHPLKTQDFLRPEIAVHNYNPTNRRYSCQIQHGHLFSRLCQTFVRNGQVQRAPTPDASSKKRQHTVKAWAEGVLVSVPGNVDCFTNNFFAHYRGWTIVVALHTLDRDWGWLAHTGYARSIPEYIQFNKSGEGKALWCNEWFPTRDAAFADAKASIDKQELHQTTPRAP